jgi:type I restriction enzyme S subunit
VTSGSRGWKEFYSKSGSIFVRTQNIKTDRLVLDDVAYVQLPVSAEGVRTRINKDDILITITGANVTKAARIEEEIPEAYVSQHIALTRPLWHEMSPWLHLCFLAPAGARGKLEELAYGDKPGLNLSNIRNLVLPIPPLLEQRKIIARVNHLMGMVDRLEAQLTTCAVKGQELLVAFMHNLLHSNEKHDPGVSEDYASNRASIGCYVMNHLLHNPNFGRTMLMKVFYLSEAHAGISQGWEPMRQAAGPYDPAIEDFELLGIQSGWFSLEKKTLSNGHEMVEYQGKSGMEAKIAEAVSVLGGRQTEFDRLLNLFQRKTTEEAEIIATLFAAWNDLLIDGKSPSDDEIIREVRENWHYKKERFTPTLLTRWLNWLRQQSVIPRGLAPRTRQQLKLGLS